MWFVYALATVIMWGGADLFYKKGADERDRYSHLKTSVAVGLVMGVSALVTLALNGFDYDFMNLVIYFPVSAMYILSMTVGYLGLRYLELSVSSPIQNASGAVSCLLLIVFLGEMPETVPGIAILGICAGVVLLGISEKKRENAEKGKTVSEDGDKKYRIGFGAFFIPIIYCVIDSLGTFLDGYYLDDINTTPLVGVSESNLEDTANVSYELTFFIVAVLLAAYVYIIRRKKSGASEKSERSGKITASRFAAAICETAGQLTYAYAMSGNGVAAAPMISAYCVASVILARIFLKERLSVGQYAAIGLVGAGIIVLGFFGI